MAAKKFRRPAKVKPGAEHPGSASPPPLGTGVSPGRLDIRTLPVSVIHAAKYNPRKDLKPGDPEWEKLKRSIETFGYVDPLIWNEVSGNLVGGHQRFKVLKASGVTEVDVSVVRLDEAQEKALNIALNKVSGAWDDEALAGLLSELSESAEIDATLSGFDDAEIDRLLEAAEKSSGAEERGEAGGGGGGGGGGGASLKDSYQVVAECRNEEEQKKAWRLMKKEGIPCRVVTLNS